MGSINRPLTVAMLASLFGPMHYEYTDSFCRGIQYAHKNGGNRTNAAAYKRQARKLRNVLARSAKS